MPVEKLPPGQESWEDQTSGETRPDIGAARGHPEPVLQFSNYGWLTTRSYRTLYTVHLTPLPVLLSSQLAIRLSLKE